MDSEGLATMKPGMTQVRVITIEKKHTVSHTNVSILSTPMMIGFMESVSAQMIHTFLPPQLTTVGYEVHIKHKSPAKLGLEIQVYSKLLKVEGRKLLFEVRVTKGEHIIGEGLHRRTIVELAG